MAVNLSPVGGVAAQFFTSTGAVLTGGKLYTYAAGTTTPATTYTTSQGNVAWSNPIVLDAAGRVSGSGEIWLTDGVIYKFVLKDSNDVLIATYDNITGINSNAVAYTNQQEIVTATAGQTVFNLGISYAPGTNSLSVFVDGVNQYGPGAQYSYVETDSDTVTFNSGLHVGAEVKFTTTQQQGAGAVDASQVTYDPPFTGSVPTNVEAKLAQTVSVKDFGAVGDGVTDDTAAIQACFDYSSSQTYKPTVFFPAGKYLISNTIDVLSSSPGTYIPNIVGENANATVLKATSGLGNAPILYFVGGSPSPNAYVGNFTLEGNSSYTEQTIGIHHINECFVKYDNIRFNLLNIGILFRNINSGFTEQNTLHNCWATQTRYFLYYLAEPSGTISFRGTGFETVCWMNIRDLGAGVCRAIYIDGSANNSEVYDAPLNLSFWGGTNDKLITNTSSATARFYGELNYETDGIVVLGETNPISYRGTLEGIVIPPSYGTMVPVGLSATPVDAATIARTSANQNVTSGVSATIIFDTEIADTNGSYNNTTGIFQPNTPGYFQVNVSIRLNATSITGYVLKLMKNGGEYQRLAESLATIGSDATISASAMVYMNGTTDYININGQITGTGTPNFNYSSVAACSFLSVTKITNVSAI